MRPRRKISSAYGEAGIIAEVAAAVRSELGEIVHLATVNQDYGAWWISGTCLSR